MAAATSVAVIVSGAASPGGSSPEVSYAEVRKGRSGCKSHGNSRSSGHRRSSTYDLGGNISAVVEQDEAAATASSSATAMHSSRGSRKSTYDTGAEYLSKKTKTSSSSKKKGSKNRSQH
ncbi:hypothetical protein HD806DRAFT_533858 [Xylariaceae sp. AK1471]|nr:hypothetical protein HD806DRAFT_533858 [Xylariaceae sp. AK1471]